MSLLRQWCISPNWIFFINDRLKKNYFVKSVHHLPSEYTDIGREEELPLGQEFQDHAKCFLRQREKDVKKKYEMAGKLIQQLE